jgi:hypothetical protein
MVSRVPQRYMNNCYEKFAAGSRSYIRGECTFHGFRVSLGDMNNCYEKSLDSGLKALPE